MPSIDLCYSKDSVFDISTSPLFSTDDRSTAFLEEWNVPKYVSKISDMKDYTSVEEIPLTNRFSCLGDTLQKEIERTGSPPVGKERGRYLAIKRESKKGRKICRHKSMSDIDVQDLKLQSCINNNKTLIDPFDAQLDKRKNEMRSKKSNIARHKSMTDLNRKPLNQKKNSETNHNCALSRNKSMSELNSEKKDFEFLKEGSSQTKYAIESLIDDCELKNSGFLKSQKKHRRSRKSRKLNSTLIKSKSTSDLSQLNDEDALFNDQSYVDFSNMLKSVKQTLQEIIDVSNKENLSEVKENEKAEEKRKKVQSKLPVKCDIKRSIYHKSKIVSQTDSNSEKKESVFSSAKKSQHLTDSETTNLQEKIKTSQSNSNNQKNKRNERLVQTPVQTGQKNDPLQIIAYNPERVRKKKSVTTQTSVKEKQMVSEHTQTEQFGNSVDKEMTTEEISTLTTETQTVIPMTTTTTSETQTVDLFSTCVTSKSIDQTSSNGDENSCGEEELTSDGHDEGISEGDSDTNDEAMCDEPPTVTVTPSRWLANMGMHKLCIFSSKETARIKSYDYFLPQVHDFDPNLVVVHIGMSEYPIFKDGKDEETPSVGEAIMKVVEICSDYGVKDVVLCNVKNRSTSIIRERRAKLAECLVPLCKKAGVKFKYNSKLYKQNIPQNAVKLRIPEQWLCIECNSDQPWNSEDRKRVREEILKCYDQISDLESNCKDNEKEIKILRNMIKTATEDKESTDVVHKKELLDLRHQLDDKTKEVELLRRNSKFR